MSKLILARARSLSTYPRRWAGLQERADNGEIDFLFQPRDIFARGVERFDPFEVGSSIGDFKNRKQAGRMMIVGDDAPVGGEIRLVDKFLADGNLVRVWRGFNA
ncbi:hypothetical protein [Terrarubrum flagellatum]|uniref:hypothetical protein n=1 Tax=Terrirubrum flagellatum TaxID=2895980 RepID=UPI003145471B